MQIFNFIFRTWLLALLLLAGLGPAQAQRVAVIQNYTLSIHPDGTLWAWGDNTYGQLGLGTRMYQGYQTTPQQVGTDANWTSVSAGYTHALALKTDGTLWAWGSNNLGQLGQGSSSGSKLTPVQVGMANNWASMSTGYNCSLAIQANGTLWAWGYLSNGETGLGIGSSSNFTQPTPTQVGTATWRIVRAGQGHALAVQTDGSLWAWGSNNNGQVGIGTTTPTIVGSPTRVSTATTWASVTAGAGYSLALKADGTLWAWGSNNSGQLGLGNITPQTTPQQVGAATTWASMSAGSGFALATRQDGSLWAWGRNRWGQLGNGQANTPDQLTPQQAGTTTTWVSVSAGSGHAVALRRDGSLWAWGGNYLGQLGNGRGGPQLLPGQIAAGSSWSSLATGGSHTLGIRTDGSLWAWGNNEQGQLGTGNTTDQDAPVAVGISTWQSVTSLADVTLAIRPDGSLWAWGNNYNGQLGTGVGSPTTATVPVRVGTATNWKSVSIGLNHVLALQTDGSLWAWGSNAFSQLGTGSTNTVEPAPVRVGSSIWLSIGAGWMHSVAVRQDGTLWAWGSNNNDQLGTGANTPSSSATPIRVGTGATWRSVSAGIFYNLALKTDGTLWAWGQNTFGEVGVGSTYSFVETPTQVGTATTWRSINAAGSSSVGLRQDGTLWVWGANYYGQLGLGTTTDQLTPVQQGTATWQSASIGGEHGAGIRTDNTFWTWGYNQYGQLGNSLPGSATPLYVANGGTALATTLASAAPAWSLAPNPSHGQIQLLGLPAGPVLARLFDGQGRLVRTTTEATVPTAGLASGLYLVRATAGGTTRTLRLVVE